MSPQAMSPLLRRMIEDMTIRQFGVKTKDDYIRQVREFTAFLGRSPDRAEPEDLSLQTSVGPLRTSGRAEGGAAVLTRAGVSTRGEWVCGFLRQDPGGATDRGYRCLIPKFTIRGTSSSRALTRWSRAER